MPRGSKAKKTVKKEVSAAVKSFKASSEVEEFYRFIFENNLRDEARQLTELVLSKMNPKKKRKRKLQ